MRAFSKQEYDRAKQDFPEWGRVSEGAGDATIGYALGGMKAIPSAIASGITGFTKSAASSEKSWPENIDRAIAEGASSALIDTFSPKLGKLGDAMFQAGVGSIAGDVFDAAENKMDGKDTDDPLATWLLDDPITEVRDTRSGEALRSDPPETKKHMNNPLLYRTLQPDIAMEGKGVLDHFSRAFPMDSVPKNNPDAIPAYVSSDQRPNNDAERAQQRLEQLGRAFWLLSPDRRR